MSGLASQNLLQQSDSNQPAIFRREAAKRVSCHMIWAKRTRDIAYGQHSFPLPRQKPLVEDCLTLDLAWLMRLGPIREGQAASGDIKWRRDGQPVATAQFQLDLRSAKSARLPRSASTS